MKKTIRTGMILIMVLGMFLTACRTVEVREEKEEEPMVVEIYDVIPVPEDSAAYGDYQYEFHTVRHGMAYTIGAEEQQHASFHSIMDGLEYRSGVKVKYFIFDSWERLRENMKNAEGNGTTKIILYNNSYDESLIKEVTAGNYMDLGSRFEEEGIYADENYQQEVLAAGVLDGKQLLVPILYDVNGMVGVIDEYKAAEPTYAEFLQMIEEKRNLDLPYAQLSEISTAILDGNDMDLYWYAAGEDWSDYKNQQELFATLYQYQTKYWDEAVDEMGLKAAWVEPIMRDDQYAQTWHVPHEETRLRSTELEMLKAEGEGVDNSIWRVLFSQTAYIVEASGSVNSEENAYHSVMGLINWSQSVIDNPNWQYGSPLAAKAGQTNLGYWPIQMLSKEGYAAQPTCYAAVMGDGNEEAAFRVLQELLKQPFALQFGFTTYTPAWREKFDGWCRSNDMKATGYTRSIRKDKETLIWEEEPHHQIDEVFSGLRGVETIKEIQTLLDRQLSNIQFAQIADREVQAIWQETLTESMWQGLSPEAGFELLCERMEEWEKARPAEEAESLDEESESISIEEKAKNREEELKEKAEELPHLKEFLEKKAAKEKEQQAALAENKRPILIFVGVLALISVFLFGRRIFRERVKRSGKERFAKVQIVEIDKSNGEAERNVRMTQGGEFSLGSSVARGTADMVYLWVYRLDKKNKKMKLKVPLEAVQEMSEGDIGEVTYVGDEVLSYKKTGAVSDEDRKGIRFRL